VPVTGSRGWCTHRRAGGRVKEVEEEEEEGRRKSQRVRSPAACNSTPGTQSQI